MRDESLDRLRKLRRRAELLNESLTGDLQAFLHLIDWSTFRRLPASRSEAGDVSVTTTCTALMTLAVTRGRGLGKFWEDIRPSATRSMWAAVTLIESAAEKAKSTVPLSNLRRELLSAIDTIALTIDIAAKATEPNDRSSVITSLCSAGEALIDLGSRARSDSVTKEEAARLVGIASAAKNAAILAYNTAEPLIDDAQGIAPQTKTKVTRNKHRAEALDEPKGVKQEREEPRPGKRDIKPVTQCEPNEKAFQILSLIACLEWQSSRLAEDNAFTAAMFVRTCGLVSIHTGAEPGQYKQITRRKDEHCKDAEAGPLDGKSVSEIVYILLENPDKTLAVENYPAPSTLGYWLVDAIDTLDITIREDQWRTITSWASAEFMRQASLVSARHDAMMDPIAMAMAACMLARLVTIAKSRRLRLGDGDFKLFPSNDQLLFALRELFSLQGQSGIWPKYFPLFHYPDAGANYCFSFEMLEAILAEFGPQDRDETESPDVLEEEQILTGIELAVQWCERNRLDFAVPDGTTYRGWNSGGQIKTLSRGMPESWATGAVHMFLYRLQCSLSRSIHRRVLKVYDVKALWHRQSDPSDWDGLIDMQLQIQGQPSSIKKVIEDRIIVPLQQEGGVITPKVRRSALLFGPPGTSKTSIVKALAKKIGWPFLEVNPAHFLNEGLERIYVRADEVFEELMDLRGVIVLFDEMDALVQRRSAGEGTAERLDVTRQFLTTSMLPKLSKLYDRAGVLFFMATNYQSEFDEAIKRPRRFDLLLCMAPPVWKKKLERLRIFLRASYDTISGDDEKYVTEKLGEWASAGRLEPLLDRFSFDETRVFLEYFFNGGPLRQVVDDPNNQARFTSEVNEWGQKFITLRESSVVYKTYIEKDRDASRIQ